MQGTLNESKSEPPSRTGRRVLTALVASSCVLGVLVMLGWCLTWALESRWRWQEEDARAWLEERQLGLSEAALRPEPASNGAASLEATFGVLATLDERDHDVLMDANAIYGPADIEFTMLYPDMSRAQQAALLEQVLGRTERASAAVDDALAADAIVFATDWSAGLGAQDFGPLVELKQVSYWLQARAWSAAAAGDTTRAWLELERALTLCERYREPALLGRLIRHALIAGVTRAIEGMLQTGPPPDAPTRERISAQLIRLEQLPPFHTAMRAELAFGLNTLQDLRVLAGLTGSDPGVAHWTPRWVRSAQLARERAAYTSRMRQLIEAADAPAEQVQARLAALPPPGPEHGTIANLLEPTWARAHGKDLTIVAKLRMTRILLDLAAHVAASGCLPSAPSSPLADPCRPRRTLGYRRLGPTEAKLWSVGADGKDDGGLELEQRGPSETWDEVVWFRGRTAARD